MSAIRDNRAWLQDMLTSIEHIETYTDGLNFERFAATSQIQHAVLFNFQIIGEAANKLDASFRSANPAVPWSLMIGMRNVIVHGYFIINLQIIWKTITEELPRLKALLKVLLAELEEQSS